MKIAIRGFRDGQQQSETIYEVSKTTLRNLVPELAKEQAIATVENRLQMIEVEFLDDAPSPNRFFRIGIP